MRDCNINLIKNSPIYALMTSIILSLSIYLEYYGFTSYLLNSITGLLGLYLWLNARRTTQFLIGFFLGILWFYWIGFSFRFTEMPYLTYIAIPLAGITLGTIFYILFYIKNILATSFVIWLGFSYVTLFGFEWFQPELIFINSYFGTGKIEFLALILALLIFSRVNDRRLKTILILPLLIFSLNINKQKIEDPDLKIKLVQMSMDQNKKWKQKYRDTFVVNGLNHIKKAKKEGYDIVILPETSFPITLNLDKPLVKYLKEFSKDITIVVGALKVEDKNVYNSTYIFSKGELHVVDKVFLVPFGETIPLPKWMAGWINDLFFEGSSDFDTAEKPQDFLIEGVVFRNAICYEGTKKDMFKTSGKYMIVTSNNAWFTPSIEPTIQKLIMELYGRQYGVKIYHSANMSRSEVIN